MSAFPSAQRFLADIKKRIKALSIPEQGTPIVINSRSDGLTTTGFPSFISEGDVLSFPKSLLCNEGTTLKLSPVSTLLTGLSVNRNYVLQMQIAAAICNGYTPIVLSSSGREGDLYAALSGFYLPDGINYLSNSAGSGFYNPFQSIQRESISEFFVNLVDAFQQQHNDFLIRNYINVCVRVLLDDSVTLTQLLTGQLDHMGLIRRIQNIRIAEHEKDQLVEAANSAQSVSVIVISVLQDYLCKLRSACMSTPNVQRVNTYGSTNSPRITIYGSHANEQYSGRITIFNQNNPQGFVQQNNAEIMPNGFDLSSIGEHKCLFVHLDNEAPKLFDNRPNVKCFQWYLSKTMQFELKEKPSLRNTKILLIIDDISSEILNWYKWMLDLPNSIVFINYRDFYSKLADVEDMKHRLLEQVERVFFFTTTNAASVEWISDFFGSRTAPKIVRTDLPAKDFWDVLFRQQTVSHDEQEKPRFSKTEIRNLREKGIVFSLKDPIFKPCYLENGETYIDRKYKEKVNFCTFSFR